MQAFQAEAHAPAAPALSRPRPRRAKIVATLGPSTDGLERALVEAGLDVARLNFSHGTLQEHARRCGAVRAAAEAQGRRVAIVQDLQGPKIRVGRLVKPIDLEVGQALRITTRDVMGTAESVSCTYAGLPADVKPDDCLLLDDGRIRLRVVAVQGDEVSTVVEDGGLLKEHKGINLPGVKVSASALTEKDRVDLRAGLEQLQVDYVALSFIRTAAEVAEARALVGSLGYDTRLIVKLEKGEAIQELDAILELADGVMVARGDLGVELPLEQVPILQKTIIRHANQRGIPVITATQMLESMVDEEMPTRAEASDVANAVWDGSDALMLSGETAAGRHPLLVLQMMDRIIRAAEEAGEAHLLEAELRGYHGEQIRAHRADRSAAVTHAARVLARDLGAVAIVGVTGTGRTAELLSSGRASVPIYAFTAEARVASRLALWWGVTPILAPIASSLERRISDMESGLLTRGVVQPGECIVVTGVHPYEPGVRTNFVKYEVVAEP